MSRKLVIVLILFILSQPLHQVNGTELDLNQVPENLEWRYTNTKINVVIDPALFVNSSFTINDILDFFENVEYTSSSSVDYAGIYTPEIEISYLSIEDHQKLIQFLKQIEETGSPNGYELNSSAFYDESYSEVFKPIEGRAYNADQALDWISNNIWDGQRNAYTLILLNLEEIDDEKNHWFITKPSDIDTGKYGNKFYTGTSGLELGKQVSAWGGRDNLPVHFIDFSSKVWYGDYINDIWSSSYIDNTIKFIIQDFEDRNSIHFLDWVRNMIWPIMDNSFSNRLSTQQIMDNSDSILVNPKYSVPTVVIVEDDNRLVNDQWTISQHKIYEILSKAFPFLNFEVNVSWVSLDNYPSILDAINLYKENDESSNQTYIELTDGFLNYIINNELEGFFGDFDNSVIPSLVFYLENMEFRYYGDSISGLGGLGWQFQIMTNNRMYDTHENPQRGFSQVLLHEIGHSLGFYHAFERNDHWISDFSASIMGYYTSYPDFSLYEKDALARLYADHLIIQAEYLEIAASIDNDIENGISNLNAAKIYYSQMAYVAAIESARNSIFNFQNPPVFTIIDSTTSTTTGKLIFSILPSFIMLTITIKIKKFNN